MSSGSEATMVPSRAPAAAVYASAVVLTKGGGCPCAAAAVLVGSDKRS